MSCLCRAGFEYAVEMSMGGYGPVCKNYHLCRRRRWVRMRLLVQPKTMQIQEVGDTAGAGSEEMQFIYVFAMSFAANDVSTTYMYKCVRVELYM